MSLDVGGGWTCSRCTYRHRAPGHRCVMCDELRVTKQQMSDFVQGKYQFLPRQDTSGEQYKNHNDNNDDHHDNNDATENDPKDQQDLRGNDSKCAAQDKLCEETAQAANSSNSLLRKSPDRLLPSLQAVAVHGSEAVAQSRSQKHVAPSKNHPKKGLIDQFLPPAVHFERIEMSKPKARRSPQQKQQVEPSAARAPLHAVPAKVAVQMPLNYKPGPVPIAEDLLDQWYFPVDRDYSKRDYQLQISESAIFHNTLVSLPTGLGKTLVAAVVLYNFYRWFPTGKILFLAPTLPLVNQQVQACYDIMGIPAVDTAVLTGKTNATRRHTIWHERRVFFCTPQTVQKDVASGCCPSACVVCIVLDEAHKAVGDYAYVKVIELLEQAGARFRCVGLSATPGPNIKAIQHVVTALRINKIEARNESDSTVAPYIHERLSEIIIVKQTDDTKSIERLLLDIITPLLDRIRQQGGLPRFHANATVTAFALLKAQEEYKQRLLLANGGAGAGEDTSIFGCFHAARIFVQLRTDLVTSGVGVVRTKLQRLINERQRGMVAHIVRGAPFQSLWQATLQATSSSTSAIAPGSQQHQRPQHDSRADNLRNNPKLAKLREILQEHFERARASNTSSRAIVFSQFRDSVAEIVSEIETLNPMVRARHFIGQGNGSYGGKKGPSADEEATTQLKGMKQSEQHQVIREFRDNVYNVLVCTCIAEEGLDVGEVDLIVNFDTLRSPIRMIQRTGRTGRKRDGRVVCLVAEGVEERSLHASRQAERTLLHALKSARAFAVLPTVPLFPRNPVLCERNMLVAQNFHLSQVQGHQGSRKVVLSRAGDKASSSASYRLTDAQEAQRRAVLGDWSHVKVTIDCYEFPLTLRRRFLLARQNALCNHHEAPGRTTAPVVHTLLHLEGISNDQVKAIEGKTKKSVHSNRLPRAWRNQGTAMDYLFPLENMTIGIDDLRGSFTPGLEIIKNQLSIGAANHRTVTNATPSDAPHMTVQSCKSHALIPTACAPSGTHEIVTRADEMPRRVLALAVNVDNRQDHAMLVMQSSTGSGHDKSCQRRLPNPYQQRTATTTSSSRIISSAFTPRRTAQVPIVPKLSIATARVNGNSLVHPMVAEPSKRVANPNIAIEATKCIPKLDEDLDKKFEGETKMAATAFLSVSRPHAAPGTTGNKAGNHRGSSGAIRNPGDEFYLPSPQYYSSSDEEEDKDDNNLVGQVRVDAQIIRVDLNDAKAVGNEFCLPSQESSSTSTSDISVDDGHDHEMGLARTQSRNIAIFETTKAPMDQPPLKVNSRRDCSPLHSETLSPEELAVRPCKKKNTGFIVLDSSPSTVRSETTQSQNQCTHLDCLTNTPSNKGMTKASDEIVCGICGSGESPDEDPIILCDGSGQDNQCSVAVHTTCYSAIVDPDPTKEWRCDTCDYRYRGNKDHVSCAVCGRADGILKRLEPDVWKHPLCHKDHKAEPSTRRQLKRLRPLGAPRSDNNQKDPGDVAAGGDRVEQDRAWRQKRRRQVYAKYMETEAEIDSEEDMDGDDAEEDEIRAIEEEEAELESGFINDTSQLGYTQDDLDKVDPEENDGMQRALDNRRERMQMFKTPLLNRRMTRKKDNEQSCDTQTSITDSGQGLGHMHFIRSVLEHHRKGGDANQIEDFYKRLEAEEGLVDEDNIMPVRNPPEEFVVYYDSGDGSD